jgi:endonuclease YncB( thermonuclease family)
VGRSNEIWQVIACFADRLGTGCTGPPQTLAEGGTINLDGTTYRIWGIDAAETKQTCADGWMAGQEASKAMLEPVRDETGRE